MYKYIQHIAYYCLVSLMVFLAACGGDPKPDKTERSVIIKNTSQLLSPTDLQKRALGDLLTVKVSGRKVGIDSIAVSYQNKKLFSSTDSTFTRGIRTYMDLS